MNDVGRSAADALFDLSQSSPTAFSCPVGPLLARPDGGLFGGAALALAVHLAQVTTQRPSRWMTVQYVAPSGVGSTLDIDVVLPRPGRHVTQISMTARDRGKVVFFALGATALDRPDEVSLDFMTMPSVPGPGACRSLGRSPGADHPTRNMMTLMEVRLVPPHDDADDDLLRLWVRGRGLDADAVALGFLSDWVPAGFRGVGSRRRAVGNGISLDGTIRFARPDPTEWILVEVEPQLITGGYGSGQVSMWSQNGVAVAVASQTAIILGAT